MQSLQRQNLIRCIYAVFVSLFIAVLLTWPVGFNLSSMLVGHPGNDTWNHVWGYWWVSDHLENGVWPIRADLMSWPNGGSLYFIDTIQAILSWPIQKLFGPVVAFNLVIIFQLALCGFGAWLLAWKKTGDPLASYVALFIFELTPHILGQAYNGISETICAGWFPLCLWALFCLMERPNYKNSLLLAAIGSFCILSSWYYGLFAAIASLILLIWSAWNQHWLYQWKKIFLWLFVSAILCGSLVIGPFLSFRNSLGASDALVTREPEFVERSLINHNITDVLAFFNPTSTPSPDLFSLYGEELIIVIYIGWIALFLAIYALFSSRQSKDIAPWIWLFIFFFVFSLGPYLNVSSSF